MHQNQLTFDAQSSCLRCPDIEMKVNTYFHVCLSVRGFACPRTQIHGPARSLPKLNGAT